MNKLKDIRYLTRLALLIAIVLVMSYTPLGMVPIGPINASLLTIPVAVGAMTMGPLAGAILGAAFGATSFMNAVEGKSALGMNLMAASPAGYFVEAVIGRILCGLCCALIYLAIVKLTKNDKASCVVGALACPLLNTLFYMGFMMLFFYNTDYIQSLAAGKGATNPFGLVIAMVGFQGCVEAIVCCVVASTITIALRKVLK